MHAEELRGVAQVKLGVGVEDVHENIISRRQDVISRHARRRVARATLKRFRAE